MFNRTPDWPAFYFHEELAGDEIVIEGLKWLLQRAEDDGEEGVVVAPTRSHYEQRSILGYATRTFRCETARTLHARGAIRGPILAVWPRDEVLDQIEEWHAPSALCVVPWQLEFIEKWRLARRPVDLLGIEEVAPEPTIEDPVVLVAMESVNRFVNVNNNLAQPEDKAAAVDALQKLDRAGHILNPAELEVWALANGWEPRGAARLREYAEKIRNGRSLRFYGFSWKPEAAELWRQEAEKRARGEDDS